MRLMKKISIFAIVTALLCSLLCVSVFAEAAETESEAEVISHPISVEGYELGVHCPKCDAMGLKYDGEYFACQNKKCGYMYVIKCPYCEGTDFEAREDGLFVCVSAQKGVEGSEEASSEIGESIGDEKCGVVFTLVEVQDNLFLAKKPASGKLDMNLKVDDFGQRLEIVLEGFVTGMLAVFAVLALLWGIFTVTGFIFKKPGDKKTKAPAKGSAPVEAPAPAEVEVPVVAEEQTDDGEIAAVITAAVAAMIESGDYKNEFVGGFRVVSFKRSANSAWNKK